MKFTITINQKQALELGLTNVNQAIILGLLADAHSWAEHEVLDNEVYYWTARQKISDELPLLDLKPDSVYRHLKSLAKLGLIDYIKIGKKDCARLTKLGKSYYVGNKSELVENSEINPTKLGNKSENNSEINPTYKNTNLIRATRDNNKIKNKKTVLQVQTEEKLLDYSNINRDAFSEWINYKKYKNISAITKTLNLLEKYDFNTQQQMVDNSIMNEYQGLFSPKPQHKPTNNTNVEYALQNNVWDLIEHNNQGVFNA